MNEEWLKGKVRASYFKAVDSVTFETLENYRTLKRQWPFLQNWTQTLQSSKIKVLRPVGPTLDFFTDTHEDYCVNDSLDKKCRTCVERLTLNNFPLILLETFAWASLRAFSKSKCVFRIEGLGGKPSPSIFVARKETKFRDLNKMIIIGLFW